MRRALFVPLLCLGFVPAAFAQAPTKLRSETIRVPEAEVRAGPSSQYPATGVLHRGAQIWIKGDATNDFLEIAPPPGSVSWIPRAVIEPFGPMSGARQAFRVVGERSDGKVPVLPGSIETNGPLEVMDRRLDIERGTQGYLIGRSIKPTWDTREWFPILPLPGESRFISKSAITEPSAGSPQLTASAKMPAMESSSMARLSGDQLYKQAEQAEHDGNIDLAIQLYNRVTRQESARNFDLANRAATKVFELSRNGPVRNAPGTLVSRSGTSTSASSPAAGGPSSPPLPGGSPNAQPARLGTANPTANANTLRSSGVGWLRRTGFQIDNKPSYALINSNRQIMYYVTAEPGVNLAPYTERWVELFGAVEVRGDVRGADYMRVSRVNVAR